MKDAAYYKQIASIISGMTVEVKDTIALRGMADLMDETTRRAVAAQEAEAKAKPEGDKASGGDES